MDNKLKNVDVSVNKNYKKKKKHIVIIVVALVLILLLELVKMYLINVLQDVDYIAMNISEPWKVSPVTLKSDEYFTIGKIKMKDIRMEVKIGKDLVTPNKADYLFVDENGEDVGLLSYMLDWRYIDQLKFKENYEDKEIFAYPSVLLFFAIHNFKNDYELYKYITELSKKSPTMLTPFFKVVDSFIATYIIKNANQFRTYGGDLIKVEGKDNCYVFYLGDRVIVFLETKDRVCRLDFYKGEENNYFTDDKIKEIISTLELA